MFGLSLLPQRLRRPRPPELVHMVCCDDTRTLCGEEIGGDGKRSREDVDCVVCLDLADQPCSPTCDWRP